MSLFTTSRTVDTCKFVENGNTCGKEFKVNSGNRRYCDEHSAWKNETKEFRIFSDRADKYLAEMDNHIPEVTMPKIIAIRGKYTPTDRERPFVEWRDGI